MKLKTNVFADRATRVAHLASKGENCMSKNFGTRAALAAVLVSILAPSAIWGQGKEHVCENSSPAPSSGSCYIDNFETGAVRMLGSTTQNTTTTQTGEGIYGGNRAIEMVPNWFGTNTFAQPAQVQVRPSGTAGVPSALLLSNGYSAFPAVIVTYGQTTALNLNLVPYNQLQLSFVGLSGALDLHVLAFDPTGANGAAVCAVYPQSGEAFTLDIPLANFSNPALDWSSISAIDLGFYSGDVYGTPNLAITAFSAILPTDTTGTVSCVPPAS
jgi:hypothetical protein